MTLDLDKPIFTDQWPHVFFIDNASGLLGVQLTTEVDGVRRPVAKGWYRRLPFPHEEGTIVGPYATTEEAAAAGDCEECG
jgi:hypothetical protein